MGALRHQDELAVHLELLPAKMKETKKKKRAKKKMEREDDEMKKNERTFTTYVSLISPNVLCKVKPNVIDFRPSGDDLSSSRSARSWSQDTGR